MPPIGADDHVRGLGPEVILYLDLACPHCAAVWAGVIDLELRVCVRHFPLAAQRPRSPVLHRATEAAALQGPHFWSMWDSLMADQARQDDPHLWQRAERIGLDLQRFEADRRSEPVDERVKGDFRTGIRSGVAGTPTAFDSRGKKLGGSDEGLLDVLKAVSSG